MSRNGDSATSADAWTQAHHQMWEQWTAFMQSAPGMTPDWAQAWQEAAQRGMDAWLTNAEPLTKATAQRMVAGQQIMQEFLQLSMDAWQEIADKLADGQDWQAVADRYAQQLRKGWAQTPAAFFAAAPNGAGDLWQWWQSAQENAQAWMTGPWQQAAKAGPDAMQAWMQALSGQGWPAMQQNLANYLESPALGYAREYEQTLRQTAKAAMDLNQAGAAYQEAVGEAWANAFTKFMERLVERSSNNEPITSLQELSSVWGDVADPAFYEIFTSERYIRAQGDLLTATMRYRIQQRKLSEGMAKSLDLPTRSEMDEAQEALYRQRKEIKALRKALAEATARIDQLAARVEAPMADAPAPKKSSAKAKSATAKAKQPAKKTTKSRTAESAETGDQAAPKKRTRRTRKSQGGES